MISPAASIRSIVILSGPGALPFLDCLTADLTSQAFMLGKPTSMFQSLSLLPYTGLLGTLLTLTAHHLLLNFPVFLSFHLLKMQTSSVTFCALY